MVAAQNEVCVFGRDSPNRSWARVGSHSPLDGLLTLSRYNLQYTHGLCNKYQKDLGEIPGLSGSLTLPYVYSSTALGRAQAL